MALTISIEGKGVIANSDGLTDSAGGSWTELGAGAISLSTETYLYGSSCVAGAYSNKAGWHYYDIGSGNELDFSNGGTEEGQLIYMPIFNPTPGLNESMTNGGLRIQIGSSTSDYREFIILASDDFNEWNGSWKTFVIDPTKTGSVSDTGTFDLSAVRYFGIYVDATALAKGDNIFIDQISVGFGLRVTGTSTTGWQDIVDYCTDYTNRAWGMVEKRGDTIYVKGKIFIGDSTQTAITTFSDSAKSIQFEKSEYWSGSAWVSTMPTDACGIIFEDAVSYATTYQDGVIVGTDNGRSGSSFTGNDNENVFFDIFNTTKNNAGSVALFYGTKFQSIYGTIDAANDADFKFLGCSFVDSSQFNPVGAPMIRNCVFAETSDVDAALLWNENIDIQDCTFIANTLGAAIEHPSAAGTPYDYYDLLFSGNTYDGLNTSGSNISVNNNGTSNAANDEGANTITYLSSATLSLTVTDENGDPVGNAYAYIDDDDVSPYIMNTTTNATTGIASVGWTGGAVTGAIWRVRKYGYKPFKAIADVPASGAKDIPVTLVADPQQT